MAPKCTDESIAAIYSHFLFSLIIKHVPELGGCQMLTNINDSLRLTNIRCLVQGYKEETQSSMVVQIRKLYLLINFHNQTWSKHDIPEMYSDMYNYVYANIQE